ncbi:MAG: hypothetical protein IPO48_20405 [Saprospiraceae bacterium]|nr:hypothetical protein [Saprospiraceae bacterium]
MISSTIRKLSILSEQILAENEISIEQKYQKELLEIPDLVGETKIRAVKQVNQYFFRQMVTVNYSGKCTITGIDIPNYFLEVTLFPWSQNEKERLNPEKVICLSALYDKAFDKGLIGIK